MSHGWTLPIGVARPRRVGGHQLRDGGGSARDLVVIAGRSILNFMLLALTLCLFFSVAAPLDVPNDARSVIFSFELKTSPLASGGGCAKILKRMIRAPVAAATPPHIRAALASVVHPAL